MSRAAWRKLCGGSLLLAALCGFIYGWKHRAENPPSTNTMRTEEPPEMKLLRKGRYDDAVKATLDSIKDDKKDYLRYQSVANVYYARSVKDPTNRDKWAEQASFYLDKSVNLSPNDSINLLEAAFAFVRIGDTSSQGCQYYEKARHDAEDAKSQLKGDSIFVGDEKIPAQPIRDELDKLLNKLRDKIEAKCLGKP